MLISKMLFSILHQHHRDLTHVVMKNGLLAAIIPFDGYARPILFSDSIRRHQRRLTLRVTTSAASHAVVATTDRTGRTDVTVASPVPSTIEVKFSFATMTRQALLP